MARQPAVAADVWISAKNLAQQGEGGGLLFRDKRRAGKDFAYQELQVFVAVAKKTEVAYFHEPVGQDVHEETPDELEG